MNTNVALINLGAGNVGAIANRLSELDVNFSILDAPNHFEYTHLILPGVGSFDDFMQKLKSKGLEEFIIKQSKTDTKILGICVGMHALAYASEEGDLKGLGLIPGKVKKIKSNLPLPHMGWNSILISNNSPILYELDDSIGFYYLHNYEFKIEDGAELIAYSDYGQKISGIVKNGNNYGIQFHPEKSHNNGLLLFRNFLNL